MGRISTFQKLAWNISVSWKIFRSGKRIDLEKFCPIPFLQLQLNPFGNISACCFSGEHKVGNIRENGIEEIWNGPEMRKWRKEFIDGDVHICKKPMQSLQCHKNYRHLIPVIEFKEVQSAMPRRLDLRLNGQCNLECVMCDVWRDPNHVYDETDFWRLGPERIFPHLLEVDMLGGEPFIQKDTYRFMDAVLKVNSRCTWGFITNCQYKFNSRLESYLDRVKLRHIHMSVDSLDPEVYAQIRRGGDLAKTLATVQEFVRYRKRRRRLGDDFVLFASMCVQKDNWDGIPPFLAFCDEHELQPIFQVLIGCGHLSLGRRTLRELQSLASQLDLLPAKHRQAVRPLQLELHTLLSQGAVAAL